MAAKKSEENNIIKWTGSAGIESASKLQKELFKSIKASDKILLDLSELEDIDITGIQLILAARKEAELQKKFFGLTGLIPQSISEYLEGCNVSFDQLFITQEISNA